MNRRTLLKGVGVALAGLKEMQEALEQCLKARLNKPAEAGWSGRGVTAPPPEGGGKQRLAGRMSRTGIGAWCRR